MFLPARHTSDPPRYHTLASRTPLSPEQQAHLRSGPDTRPIQRYIDRLTQQLASLATPSSNSPNRSRRRPRRSSTAPARTSDSQRTLVSERPPTPIPRTRTFLAPAVEVLGAPIVRNPDIPLINQANEGEPHFPSLIDDRSPRFRTLVEVDEDDIHPGLPIEPLYCYYPEYLYIGATLPTRPPQELSEFLRHCRTVLNNNSGVEVNLNHPLNEARQITTSALNFENLLWKSRTIVSSAQVIEEYQWIRRLIRAHKTDKAFLDPAYRVTYLWNQEGWTVTRFFANPRQRE